MFWEPLGPLVGPLPPPPGGLPDGPWPQDSPESQGVSSSALARVRGIQHGVCLRHGVEIYTWGDPGRTLDWASCNRTWLNVLWGQWVTVNGWGWLDRPVRELPCAVSNDLPNPGAALKNVLSYTSLPPVGQVWRYSSGEWWPWQSEALAQLYEVAEVGEAWALHVQPYLGGSTFRAGMASDGTLRVKASCRDNARLAGLLLNGGIGIHGQPLISAQYVARSMAGGPDGDGYPFPWEGLQTHLIRDFRCNAGSSQNSPQWVALPDVPEGCLALDGGEDPDHGWGAIVAIPSLSLIVAARGATPAWWLPQISSACR